MASQLLCATLR